MTTADRREAPTAVTRAEAGPLAAAIGDLAAGPRPALLEAALAAPSPALVFDLDALVRRMRALALLAHRHDVRVVFAVASFPSPVVIGMARRHLDGLALSGPGELAHGSGRIVAVTAPALVELDQGFGLEADRLLVSCETPGQAARIARHRRAELVVRLSATGLAPGLRVSDTPGGHSRFGVGRDVADAIAQVRAIAAAAPGRVRGVHLHHGGDPPLGASELVRAVTTAVEVARAADVRLEHVGIGGLHGVPVTDLELFLAALRDAVPREVDVLVEPARLLTMNVGVAGGRVLLARDHAAGPLRVLDLSRACHLRATTPRLLAPPDTAHVTFVGPTCLEHDRIGRWTCSPARFAEGTRVLFAGITGDSAAWNTGFAGIGPARLEFIGARPRSPS